ncbi:hypothetical protein PCASD_21597 [Puccinia coronata f. sp. avenae]|uniref:Uncharacterized protein n=1 Tax=Puccinia coronata f. sp. avenae TaxID=200324 RepID=A0A2N5SWE7_9BASI|nr:hypothetical protein PCASD_21597 [Puccinia coronata f. sp. avenae]
MSDKPVRQVCLTWDRTILSDAMSNKPGLMVAEQAGSDLLGRTCLDIFAEQANDLLGKELANSRPACCELAG